MVNKLENKFAVQSIIEAAVRVYGELGLANTTPDKICEKAGISKGTLVHYFNSKTGLFLACFDYSTAFFMEKLEKENISLETDIFKRLKRFIEFKLDLIQQNTSIVNIIEEVRHISVQPGNENSEIKKHYEEFSHKCDKIMLLNLNAKHVKDNLSSDKSFKCIYDITKLYTSYIIESHSYDFKTFEIRGEILDMLDYFKDGIYKKQ